MVEKNKFEKCEKCPITNKEACLRAFGSVECGKILLDDLLSDKTIWISIIDLEKEIEQYLIIKYKLNKVKIDIRTITFEIIDNTGKLKLKKTKKYK